MNSNTICASSLKVILFGGASDGALVDLGCQKEKIPVGINIYADSFFMDKDGYSVYYACAGPGRMKKSYVNKLFKDENIF